MTSLQAALTGPGLLLLASIGGCVPEGPATGNQPDEAASATPAAPATSSNQSQDPPLRGAFNDSFDRAELGADWRALSPNWRLRNGELCGKAARNRGVWLKRRLPINAEISFDARSDSSDGDLKVELWGDGRSGATHASYNNATSYLLIFGGWNNRLHVLARLDEHGRDRLVRAVDIGSSDRLARPVAQGQSYHFRIERRDGRRVRWWIDDSLMHEFNDPKPLSGDGHDHLGFNNWLVPVCFDNLRITPR